MDRYASAESTGAGDSCIFYVTNGISNGIVIEMRMVIAKWLLIK